MLCKPKLWLPHHTFTVFAHCPSVPPQSPQTDRLHGGGASVRAELHAFDLSESELTVNLMTIAGESEQ